MYTTYVYRKVMVNIIDFAATHFYKAVIYILEILWYVIPTHLYVF